MTNRRLVWAFAILLGAYYAVSFFYGDRIPISGGVGWDGRDLTLQASAFFDQVLSHRGLDGVTTGMTDYRAKRLLPAVIVYGIGRLLRLDLNRPEIWSDLFYGYNCALLLIVLFLSGKIAAALRMKWERYALLLFGLFVNFANFKFMTYYPTLGDTTAFFLGFLALYLHVMGRTLSMLLVLLAGLWTWPTAWLFTTLLLIYRKGGPLSEQPNGLRPLYFCYGIFAGTAAYLWLFYTQGTGPLVKYRHILLSLSIATAYVAYYTAGLPRLRARRLASELRLPYLAGCGILILASTLAFRGLSDVLRLTHHPMNLTFVLSSTGSYSLLFPGGFLLQQFLYYGPALVLFLLYFRKIAGEQIQSVGLLVLVLLTLAMAMHLEQRIIILQAPIRIFLAVIALPEETINSRTVLLFAIASLFAARPFLPLDMPARLLMTNSELRVNFPQQFFWSISYSMSWAGYYLGLFTALPVVLPVLIERAMSTGILPLKSAFARGSTGQIDPGALDGPDPPAPSDREPRRQNQR
jgi:hypothetical protein